MKNIVVPTDFSETARTAYWYARELALYLEGNLKVLHIYHPSFDPTNPYMTMPIEQSEMGKKARLKQFVEQASDKEMDTLIATDMYEQELRLGFAAEEIVRESAKEEVDLIVMGTTGQSGFLEKLFGSISLEVSKKAHCPVLLIPNGQKFRDLRNVAYASNYESADEHLLKEITDFAALFSADIHLVHVNESSKKGNHQLEEILLEKLFNKKAPDLEFTLRTIDSDTVWSGLNQYIEDNEVDLIVIATKHRNFWERLTHKSSTTKMLEHVRIPIMVMPIES